MPVTGSLIEFLHSSWDVLTRLAFWFLLGASIAGLLHGFLPAGFVRRRLRGTAGVVKAVLLGVPLPLCSCGVVPAGIGLRKDGASKGAAVGFLISTPQTGVDSILVSASFLGWPFALFKVASAALIGLVGGWLTERLEHEPPSETAPATGDGNRPAERRTWRAMLAHAVDIIDSIRYWLILGIVVSAAIDVLVPQQGLRAVGHMGTLSASLLMLLISVPLYVCATASVPIGAALVQAGFPPGAALVFLMAGPATNTATIGAVYREFGLRTMVIYLLTIITGSVVLAQLFDGLIAPEAVGMAVPHHEHPSWWSVGAALILAATLGWLIFRDLARRIRKSFSRPTAASPTIVVPVDGMKCQACVSRLERALEQTEGVDSVDVQLKPGQAIIHGDVDRETIATTICDAGFSVPASDQETD